MFGYITINKGELKFKDFDIYHSFYCGLCRKLKDNYGRIGQSTLSFDMTFLIILLTGLYEPDTTLANYKCIVHPFRKHPARLNEFTEYVADMNIVLSYFKCKDDWTDEKKYIKLAYSKLLKRKCNKIQVQFSNKINKIDTLLEEINKGEEAKEKNVDLMAGKFGKVMAEIFAYKQDIWEESMRKIGFYLGKFIYLMDAYEDIEEDIEKGNYNPFIEYYKEKDFEKDSYKLLTMMMAECSREFERLPILTNVEILRNILYSGVWTRYELVGKKRNEKQVQTND